MAEKVETIEFNSMVAVLKRLDGITNSMNDSRRRNDIGSYYQDLISYYMEIRPSMTTTEISESEKILKVLKTYVRSLGGIVNTKRNFLLDRCEELEKLLKMAASIHGYLTKNIKTDIVKAL